MKKFDLEDRFIDFTIRISNVVDEIDDSKLGVNIAGQLIRSGSSPALNYGEAQSAESRKDFIHKIKVALKELREALTGDDTEKIKEKTDALSKILQKASAAIYQQAAQQYQQQQSSQSTSADQDTSSSWEGHPSDGDEKTINADYKIKDEKKDIGPIEWIAPSVPYRMEFDLKAKVDINKRELPPNIIDAFSKKVIIVKRRK